MTESVIKTKYLFRNITLLNILLIAVLSLILNYTILPFINADIRFTLPSQKKKTANKDISPAEHTFPSLSDYLIIGNQNLFHPERHIPPEIKPEQEQQLPMPEFVAYGTVITDNVSIAYLEDQKAPRTSTGRGKRQVALKKGDVLSGFTLKNIDPDKIVMVRGKEELTVYVSDPGKRKKGAAQPPPQRAERPDPRKLIKEPPTPANRPSISEANEKALDFFRQQRQLP